MPTFNRFLISWSRSYSWAPIFMSEGRAREFSFTDPLFAYAIVPAVPNIGSGHASCAGSSNYT
jgi:hypothetical protein